MSVRDFIEPLLPLWAERSEDMEAITPAAFSAENRDRRIGNSQYRVCQNEKGPWYIHECYNDLETWSRRRGCFSYDLIKVLDKLNSFTKEREIIEGGDCIDFGNP